ncbi:hypothetical protein GCK72_016301 [Caenorhabditis remanei]|uniref:cAMP-dependent protein kinase type II-alpha regulatory subunit n=1 Tax=Caenorhabditis remanei TaxID=31234 RepID=A0A6A5GZ70_CAERE|nr:hypothetical protein GCK72_016301 [Caenorhabditis remanei]KAF1759834.1 hypothetical protein GCK72_016301 [Caenorhabditis remanei]
MYGSSRHHLDSFSSNDGGAFLVQVGSRTFEAHELQKLIPQLEEAITRKDAQLRQQQSIVEGHIKRISELEGEVTTLQRECDKLRSVLEQKAQSAASPGQPPSPSPRTDQLGNDLQQKAVLPADGGGAQRAKKIAVSAEPTNFENKPATLQHYNKTVSAKQMIRDAVQKNDFLKQLAKEQIIELVNCMYEMRARAGQWVIQEGEPGDRLFVVAEGELQVSREGALLGKMRAGTVMGELAILYNCTRFTKVLVNFVLLDEKRHSDPELVSCRYLLSDDLKMRPRPEAPSNFSGNLVSGSFAS